MPSKDVSLREAPPVIAYGHACPHCGFCGPHFVYAVDAGVAATECGDDPCATEFSIHLEYL